MNIKLLTEYHLEFLNLIGGYTGSSESIHVKMPHCWKWRVVAHIICSAVFFLFPKYDPFIRSKISYISYYSFMQTYLYVVMHIESVSERDSFNVNTTVQS